MNKRDKNPDRGAAGYRTAEGYRTAPERNFDNCSN